MKNNCYREILFFFFHAGHDALDDRRLPQVSQKCAVPGRGRLRGALHHGRRRRRDEAEHINIRRRPVRRFRPARAAPEGVLLQLVDVQLVHRSARSLARARIRAGERRVGARIRDSDGRAHALTADILSRHAELPA